MAFFLTKNFYFRTKNSFATPYFTQFVLSHASNYTTSGNVGGRMHRPSSTSNFGDDRPQSLLSLRPCIFLQFRVFNSKSFIWGCGPVNPLNTHMYVYGHPELQSSRFL